MKTKKVAQNDLQKALAACRVALMPVVGISFVINLLMFAAPLYMLNVYDRVLSTQSIETLVLLTVIAIGALMTMGVLEAIRSRLFVRVGIRLDALLNRRVFAAVFEASVRTPGKAGTQNLRDVDQVREFLTGNGLIAFFDAPWTPVFLAVVFLMNFWLGLVALVGALIIFSLALMNEVSTRKVLREASGHNMLASGYAENSLKNSEVLRAMGMMPGILTRWAQRHSAMLALQAKASDRAGIVLSMSKFVRMTLQVAILGVGAFLAVAGEITPGTMIAASIVMGRALQPVEMAVGNWKNFVNARGAYGRLKELLTAIPAEEQRMQLPRPTGKITLERVIAAPPGSRAPVLKGVSLQALPGAIVGEIGPSAAGKSTLARVMVGVWPVASGSVRLDGAELDQYDPILLGPHIGYLPQDVELFDGTVAENIARFGTVEADKVIAAAQAAGVHDMILNLPDGYDTQLGYSGTTLSGGQHQRIGLARALYGDPPLVVLDEPNSNLDQEGETALAQAFAGLRDKRCTVIVITHRMSLLSSVDQVMVMKEGVVVNAGPRDEVLKAYTQPALAASRPAVQAPAGAGSATARPGPGGPGPGQAPVSVSGGARSRGAAKPATPTGHSAAQFMTVASATPSAQTAASASAAPAPAPDTDAPAPGSDPDPAIQPRTVRPGAAE